jgi:iron complex transport system ATP-binding protein
LTPIYKLRGAGMRYGHNEVLRGIDLELQSGRVVAITGPNGAGKSTLLSILAGLRHEHLGSCLFYEREVRNWPRRKFAQQVSVVPQSLQIEFPFTAEQVVVMGRTPFCDGLFESPEDLAAVDRAMQITDTTQFRARDFRSLSGGERQRVVLASALAQTPKVLLLDEPTTFLDPEHQVALFRILRGLAADGLLVVIVTHDLNLAVAYSQEVLLLRAGELRAAGPPDQVLDAATLRDVFSVDAELHVSDSGRRWIVYGD